MKRIWLILIVLCSLTTARKTFSQIAPNLLSPANGATGVSQTPQLSWDLSTNSSYKVQISIYGYWSGTDLVWQGFNLPSTATSTTVPSGYLGPEKPYRWRVIGFAGTDNSGASAISFDRTFTTVGLPPAIPALSAPTNASTNVPVEPVLTWGGVAVASTYRYQISTGVFSSTYVDVGTTSDNLTGTKKLAYGTKYNWHVAACNIWGCSAYSSTWSFTTGALITPGVAQLSSPSNNAVTSGTSGTLSWSATNATYYSLQVSTASDFSSLAVDMKNEVRTSFVVTGLILGQKYYWRVQAFNSTSSAWSSVRAFTPANPSGPLITPRGSLSTINSPFGPRAKSGASSWFHTGIDFGPSGGGFKAPYNMNCTYVNPSPAEGRFRIMVAGTDPLVEPRRLMFEELAYSDIANITVGQGWTQGVDLGVRGSESGDAFIHMEACRSNDCTEELGPNWYTNRSHTSNPLEWYNLSGGAVTVEKIDPLSSPLPQEGGVRYFDVHVNATGPRYSLDRIQVDLSDLQGKPANQLFQNQVGARIGFNGSLSIDRGTSAGVYDPTTQESSPLFGYSKTRNGVKIFTEDFNQNGTKKLVFRYYVLSDDIQEIMVSLLDFKGTTLDNFTRKLNPGCVNCPGLGPLPPDYLVTKTGGNGIDLRWNKSPDKTKTTFNYAIYRRIDGSTQVPEVVALVPYTNLFYCDLFDSPYNGLEAGKKYRYSIASVGDLTEGCNGPRKPNCGGMNCPLSCVQEVVGTAPSTPVDLVYRGQTVRSSKGTIKALNSVTLLQDTFLSGGSVIFQAGHRLIIEDGVTIENGSNITLTVTN